MVIQEPKDLLQLVLAVLKSWETIAVTAAVLLYTFLVLYVANMRRRPPPPPKIKRRSAPPPAAADPEVVDDEEDDDRL